MLNWITWELQTVIWEEGCDGYNFTFFSRKDETLFSSQMLKVKDFWKNNTPKNIKFHLPGKKRPQKFLHIVSQW